MNKEFIIAGLRKQHHLLEDLIVQLEEKINLDHGDFRLYDEITKQVEKDLRKLKKLNNQGAAGDWN